MLQYSLTARRKKSQHRKDDEKEVIEYRWLVYKNKSSPVISYYKKKNILIRVNGNSSVKNVFKEITEKLDKLF